MGIVWVNIDKPTKKCTIHTNDRCQYVINKKETSLKGIENLKTDGGKILRILLKWGILPLVKIPAK